MLTQRAALLLCSGAVAVCLCGAARCCDLEYGSFLRPHGSEWPSANFLHSSSPHCLTGVHVRTQLLQEQGRDVHKVPCEKK